MAKEQLVMLSLQASVKAYLSSLIQVAKSHGITAEIFDMDAHAIDKVVPESALLTYSGFSLVEDQQHLTVDVVFGVMSTRDPELEILNLLTAIIFDATRSGISIPAKDYKTGAEIGKMVVVNGTRVTPVTGEDTRPQTGVLITFLTSLT